MYGGGGKGESIMYQALRSNRMILLRVVGWRKTINAKNESQRAFLAIYKETIFSCSQMAEKPDDQD